MVASCNNYTTSPAVICPGTDAPNLPNVACADGTLEPGVYLFVSYYFSINNLSQAKVAIFDRAVGYRIIHMTNTYSIFLDVNNAKFTSWTHTLNAAHPCESGGNAGQQETNVSGLDKAPPMMSIYKI